MSDVFLLVDGLSFAGGTGRTIPGRSHYAALL